MKRPGPRSTRPWKGARPGEAAARQDPSSELFTLVAFDVPDDKVRRKVGERCKDYGLVRAQWSLFEGKMTRNRREELVDHLTALLAAAPGGGRLGVFPIGARELAWSSRFDAPVMVSPMPRAAGGDDDG